MANILKATIIVELLDLIEQMYQLGWDERNGGNISYLLDDQEIATHLQLTQPLRTIRLPLNVKQLAHKTFVVTATGKYFRNIKKEARQSLGIFKISEDGNDAQLLWGYEDGGQFTSEIYAHLLAHISRLTVDPNHKVIIHCHPTNLIVMTCTQKLDSNHFTHLLWQTATECIVVFPDGVNVLPWMVCGTSEIGHATAQAFKTSRIVIWPLHGVYASGTSLNETFGLLETVEKTATIFNRAYPHIINKISDQNLIDLAKQFNVKPRPGILVNKK